MSSTSTGASGSQDDTHWAMPSMLHNDNHHHHPKSPPTHHIWANHAQVIIANNNSDIDKSMYELPPDQSYDLSQSANRRIMKQECDSADITGEELGADIDRVKVSLIQDGDQTLTLYDLNQNHEAKVHTVLTSQESCSTSSVTSVEDSSVSDTTSLPTSSTIQALLPCVVCGDKSSGKHYGQLTCEGCKSFFKRSVRKNITYTCRGNRDCSVDPQHRNQCQYCRLRKCLKAGMRREAVQRGRVNQAAAAEYYQLPSAIPPMEHGRINPCYMTNFVTVLLRAEPYPISHMQGPQALGANIPLDNICELAARLLFTAVEWARNIPFFTELPLIDQVSLLRSSWSDLFILNTAQCCPPVYVSSILSSAFQSPAGSSSDARFHQSYTQSKLIQDQLDRFSVIRLDPAEFSSVKALCLFSPDVPGLHDPGTVQNLQEKTHASLEEYDRIQYSNQPGRAGRLLLRIPALKLINPAAVENLFFIKLIGKTPIETLIRDMLLGGSSFCWPVSADTTNNSFIRA